MSMLAAIIVLGVLILVHELGHFALAKLSGVGVERFSIGFGRKLVGWRRGETDYQVSVFPLGGYVKMVGENPAEEGAAPADPAKSFLAKPVRTRLAIVGAGPLSNLLLAVAIFAAIFLTLGIQVPTDGIGEVSPDYPAAEAGLVPGDRITAIDGRPMADWAAMTEVIHGSAGRPLRLTVSRGESTVEVTVTPRHETISGPFGDSSEVGIIGIRPAFEARSVGPLEAVGLGFERTWDIVKLTFVVIGKIFQREVPADTIGGPILMVQMAGEGARQGILPLASLVALLSINLGVFNLLPIPILDGGHLLFFLVEAVRGKPVSVRMREIAQQVGLVVLISIFLFAFYNDLARVFAGFVAP